MKSDRVIYVFIMIALNCTSANETKGNKDTETLDTLDILLESLLQDKWDRKETACVDATKSIINGVKNNTLWAAWVWNSMQLPVGSFYGSQYHFGNYDQCLKVPWSSHQTLQTQYCLVDVKLTALNQYDGDNFNPYGIAVNYIGAEFQYGRRLNTLYLGVCLPASCRPVSIAKISRHIFRLSNLPLEEVTVDPRDCQVAGASVEKPMGYYVFWFIILVFGITCILVYFVVNYLEKANSNVSNILRCFCLTSNFDALSSVRRNEVLILHGIRALTNIFLIILHLVYMTQLMFSFNKIDTEKEMSSSYANLFLHADLCVDIFFTLSGLLHIKGLMSGRYFAPFQTMLRRYLRLLFPLYFLSIMSMSYVFPYIGSGPAWPRASRRISEPCARSWWRNVLMISNRVDDEAYCLETSWYIHTDFHLTILITAMYVVYRWSKKTGFILSAVAYLVSLVVPAVWTYMENLPGILFYNFRDSQNNSTNKVYNTVYQPFYTRASSYLIGVAAGYIMSVYKPQDHRKTISKTTSILGLFLGSSLMVLCLHTGAKTFKNEFSMLTTAVLSSLDRSVWAFGICLIIMSCEYGTLPIIKNILSSKVFIPLSKLSYCNYIFHSIIIYRNVCILRTPISYDLFSLITNGLGYVTVSYSLSFLVWLFIEAPVNNLMNLISVFKRNVKVQEMAYGVSKKAAEKMSEKVS